MSAWPKGDPLLGLQRFGLPATVAVSLQATNFVMLNHAEICDRWKEYFHGDISFYR